MKCDQILQFAIYHNPGNHPYTCNFCFKESTRLVSLLSFQRVTSALSILLLFKYVKISPQKYLQYLVYSCFYKVMVETLQCSNFAQTFVVV